MNNMATYTRIFEMDPSDEYVAKRSRAVTAIRSWLEGLTPSSRSVGVASSIADAVVDGELSDDVAQVVAKAIGDQSDSFVRQGQELQMLVCAMVAALDLVRSQPVIGDGWLAADALAAGLWSALSFQQPVTEVRLHVLWSDLLSASRDRVMAIAEASRKRATVPEIGNLTIPENTPPGTRSNTAFRAATKPLVDALRNNAELDREEIDFLWWILADRSDALDMPLAKLEGASKAVIAGIDGAAKLRKLPASGHRHVVLRSVKSSGDLSLSELSAQLADHRVRLASSYAASFIDRAESVFPLLSSLRTGDFDVHGAGIKRSPYEWGARALLEGGILQVNARKTNQ